MRLTILALLMCIAASATAQSNKNYDSVLAKKLNANEMGMKKYIFVILKTGPVVIEDKTKRDSLFMGHMKNIESLASQNKLGMAGPFGKNDKELRGIFILNTENKEDAEKMVNLDPAVQARILVAEYYPWFGTAALQEILSIHKRISKN